MRLSTILYLLWCLAIVAAFGAATRYGWSPYASGGRPVFTRGFVGPQHK
jgi:hypothetical protein